MPANRENLPGSAQDTIIVGAGIAGLACAQRLHDSGHPFIVISDDVGGRIRRSPDGGTNLGAYYVRSDYTHFNRYAQLGRRLDRLAIKRHSEAGGTYILRSPRLLLHAPQVVRFLRLLSDFRRRYNQFKTRTPVIGQAAAIRSDPKLSQLYRQRASEFVDEHRLGDLANQLLEPGIHGTAFTTLKETSALTMLLAALPIVVPTYEFTARLDLLVAGFEDRIIPDHVTAISSRRDGYIVHSQVHGQLLSRRVVIATPADSAARLLGLPSIKKPVDAHMFLVEGTLRHPFSQADVNLFPATDDTFAIATQANGAILVCSKLRDPDLNRYFSRWRVVAHHYWDPAFHITGDDLLECEQGPNLFLAGDHNIVGLEDAYLTGLHAASRVIESARNESDEHGRSLAPADG
ncbi:MAG: FAD-dependent oxidoreductase [Acidimicrobiia bacterium]|nr:FAD-dependent oxidoreductase [Acidimicrobiia bacterium]